MARIRGVSSNVNETIEQLPPSVRKVLTAVALDFEPLESPPWWRWILASAVAIVGSLLADALIVKATTSLWPHLSDYPHFVFSDYAKLTIVGVIIACVAWPIVTRISSRPRWLFLLMAIAVTLVLLLPDVYILVQGQPVKAVAALVVMHLAIAVVTYCSLVFIAPAHASRGRHARVNAG